VTTPEVSIIVNGETTTYPGGTSIRTLLELRGLSPEKVAVELNRKLVRMSHYDTPLKQGDVIEIVTFVGGG